VLPLSEEALRLREASEPEEAAPEEPGTEAETTQIVKTHPS
jgi:hypothetical protein